MASKSEDMQAVFRSLTARNQDIILLAARSMQIAQEPPEDPRGGLSPGPEVRAERQPSSRRDL